MRQLYPKRYGGSGHGSGSLDWWYAHKTPSVHLRYSPYRRFEDTEDFVHIEYPYERTLDRLAEFK